jgi:hypothetical protein
LKFLNLFIAKTIIKQLLVTFTALIGTAIAIQSLLIKPIILAKTDFNHLTNLKQFL